MSSAGIENLGIDDITSLYGKLYPFDFYPELFKKRMNDNLMLAIETRTVVNQEGSVVGINQNELWYKSTIVPMYDDGQLDSIVVISINVTEQKCAEITLQRLNEELKENVETKTKNLGYTQSKIVKKSAGIMLFVIPILVASIGRV